MLVVAYRLSEWRVWRRQQRALARPAARLRPHGVIDPPVYVEARAELGLASTDVAAAAAVRLAHCLFGRSSWLLCHAALSAAAFVRRPAARTISVLVVLAPHGLLTWRMRDPDRCRCSSSSGCFAARHADLRLDDARTSAQ